VVYHPTNPDIIYFANDGGVFRTLNGGRTFQCCNAGYQTSQFYAGFSCSRNDSLLCIGGFQDNSTAIYDGQLAWHVRLIGGDGGWAAIDSNNDDFVMYGSWQFLNLLKSTNGGQSWFDIPVPNLTGGPTSFIGPFVVGRDDSDVLYAGRDVIYKSTNGGATWAPTNNGFALDGNPVLAMAISPVNSEVVYAATAPLLQRPGVFRTTNGGITWENVTGSLPNRFPGDIAVDPIDDATVYLAFSGFGSSHLFKSTNHGDTWIDIGQDLPDVPTSAVIVDPEYPNHIYVGNDLGVYVSIDGGVSWQEFQEGLPPAVLAMDLSVSSANRMLRVATHGNGAYERYLLEPAPVAVTETGEAPAEFSLEQNYPNPFNPTTSIRFDLKVATHVKLTVYNALGQKVVTLLDENMKAGEKGIVWDASNYPSGIYFYKLEAGDFVQTRRMVLLK